ncbi:hypothetical protein AgCh_040382 [Apium graveolens]
MALAAVCLIVTLLAVPAVYADTDYSVDYIVGDSAGWNTGVDYKKMGFRKKILISDHCRNGMKLKITVEESRPPPPPPKGSSNGAVGSSSDMSKVVLGICIVFAGLVRFLS